MNAVLFSLTLVLVISGFYIKPAFSQNRDIPIFSAKYKEKPEPKQAKGKEVTLPDLPRFPAAKFISAQEYGKNASVPVSYIIEYSIPKASESQVIPYYAGILSAGGWEAAHQTATSISASNESTHARCTINVSSDDNFYSRFQVNYAVVNQ